MNRERRAVLKGVAALTVGTGAVGTGGAVGGDEAVDDAATSAGSGNDEFATNAGSGSDTSGTSAGSESSDGTRGVQQIDTELPPGVTLFDLNGDGEYTATVEEASEELRDDAHPRPIHVTSNGRSTVDFAASIVAPNAETTLGELNELTYDYYEGPDNVVGDAGGVAPDQTFLVVENADGRHGMYLTYDAGGDEPAEEWATFDVLARLRGDTAGTSGWFEYTAIEDGDDAQSFDDVVERFGEDARLVRVGVGHGNAVEPATLDLYYGNLVVSGTTNQFPVSVAKRISNLSF